MLGFIGAGAHILAIALAMPIIIEKAIISPAAGLRAKSIISPGWTDTEFYYQSGR